MINKSIYNIWVLMVDKSDESFVLGTNAQISFRKETEEKKWKGIITGYINIPSKSVWEILVGVVTICLQSQIDNIK